MMCEDCTRESLNWLDYKLVRPIRIASIGAKPGDARKFAAEDWRNTILSQQRIIREYCAKEHMS